MVVDINSDNDFNGLKAKKEAMGLSLKDVFERTRISVHYLQAIKMMNSACCRNLRMPRILLESTPTL